MKTVFQKSFDKTHARSSLKEHDHKYSETSSQKGPSNSITLLPEAKVGFSENKLTPPPKVFIHHAHI